MEAIGDLLNADDPNLSGFAGRNGKLIIWHGWADAALPAGATISYYDQITGGEGIARDSFARLFLVPGMQHCRGGEGLSQFDMLSMLENWVEKDIAPDLVAAKSKGTDTAPSITRPLCPYPQKAKAVTDDASKFQCR